MTGIFQGLTPEAAGVDPDFDDAWIGDLLLAHEIESGTLALHPDGNRLAADFDPVPLLTSARTAPPVRKKIVVDNDKQAEQLVEEAVERHERMRANAAKHRSERQRAAELTGLPEGDLYLDLLIQFRITEPLKKERARVVGDMAMVHEADLRRMMYRTEEVWRGMGYVIFRQVDGRWATSSTG